MESWSEADKAHALKWAQEKAPKTKDEYFRGIADFCKRTSPSDRVCLDSKIYNKLYSLWRENAAVPNDSPYLKREEKTYGIPSDLLFARTIPLKDCDIWVDETSEPGGVVVKYRVVIFEHYDKQIDIAAKFIEEGILKDPPPILVGCIICKYSLPFYRLYFCSVYGFLCCTKAFSLIRSHLIIFIFINYCKRQTQKYIARMYVKEYSAFVFLKDFCCGCFIVYNYA